MDKEIVKVLKGYKISNLEINDMLMVAPMLEYCEYEEFVKCCMLLTEYGYPKTDLDFLFLANPNMFVRGPKDLKADLDKLRLKQEDIESILKQDPNII